MKKKLNGKWSRDEGPLGINNGLHVSDELHRDPYWRDWCVASIDASKAITAQRKDAVDQSSGA